MTAKDNHRQSPVSCKGRDERLVPQFQRLFWTDETILASHAGTYPSPFVLDLMLVSRQNERPRNPVPKGGRKSERERREEKSTRSCLSKAKAPLLGAIFSSRSYGRHLSYSYYGFLENSLSLPLLSFLFAMLKSRELTHRT